MPSHTRVVSISSTDLSAHGPEGSTMMDPAFLIGNLPKELVPLLEGLVIKLWDSETSVLYSYDSFMSKHYRIVDGFIRFGIKRLRLKGMSIIVGVRIECDDLQELEEQID